MPSDQVDTRKIHRKVFFEIFNREGYTGRNYVVQKRHARFSEADIPELFADRPYKNQEPHVPDYRYRIDEDGIHIALLYEGASPPE